MPRNIAILDTNILDYGLKPDYTESVAALIEALSQDFDLFTTQYSKFELFRGMISSKIPTAKALFDSFVCIEMSGDVFSIAAALTTCYKNDESTKSRASSFSDGDVIIGSVGFVSNASVITANMNDFPRPYFTEYAKTYEPIQSKRKITSIQVGVLEPNIPYLNEMIARVYPPQGTPK